MPRKSKEQICAELDALNVSLKNPISFSEDEPYDVLTTKLAQAEEQIHAVPKVEETPIDKVPMGKGNDLYGQAINKLIDRVTALESK